MPLDRRSFFKLSAAAILEATVLCAGGAAYAWWLEPDWLAVERVEIPLQNLHPGLDGLRLVQLSDIHYRRDLPPGRLDRVLAKVVNLKPDLLVMTGDWVTYDAADAITPAHAIAQLELPLGTYSILGNHDHWTHASTVTQAIRDANLNLLINDSVRILAGAGSIWLAGVDDVWEDHHDLNAALVKVPAGEPVILLAHEPDYADTVAADGRVALQLSGHSHGGQVHLPILGSPVVPYLGQKYVRGLYRPGNAMWLYTNRGIGTVQPAVRLNCRPEITEITLRAASV